MIAKCVPLSFFPQNLQFARQNLATGPRYFFNFNALASTYDNDRFPIQFSNNNQNRRSGRGIIFLPSGCPITAFEIIAE